MTAKKTGKSKQKPAKKTGKSQQKPAKTEAPAGDQRAQDALRESEELYRTMVESALDGIVIHSGGRVAFANRAVAAMLGVEGPAALVGQSIESYVHPDDLASVQDRTRRLLEGEAMAYPVEVRYVRRDGTELPVENTGALVTYEGKPAVLAVIRDITARKRAEEALRENERRLKQAQTLGRIGSWEFDVGNGAIEWSDQTYELYERDPALGPPTLDEEASYYAPEQAATLRGFARRAIEAGEYPDYDLQVKLPSGRPAFFSASMRPISDERGRVVRLFGTVQDVTERKRVEEALRENNERLALALDGGELGMWDWNLQTDAVTYSDRWAQMLEYRPDEVERTADFFKRHVHPEDLPAVLDRLTGHVEGRMRVYASEHRLRTKSGRLFWAMDRGRVVERDMDGRPVRVAGIIADITERKRTEEALRAGEERYRLLFASMTGGVAHCRMLFENDAPVDLIFLNVNAAFEAQTGLRNVIGRRVSEVIPGIRDADPELFERCGRVVRTGVPARFELFVSALGEWLDVSVYRPHREHFVAIFDVITDRKRVEEALRREHAMLARTEGIAHVGSWEWEIASDTVTWSDELFRIFHRDPREGAPSFAEHPAFYHPDDIARLRQAVEVAVAEGTPYELELRAIRNDGETRLCVARGIAEMSPGGRAVRLCGSLQDITERKRAEEALRESQAQFRIAQDMSPDGFTILHPIRDAQERVVDFTWVYENAAVARLNGTDPEAVVGKRLLELFPGHRGTAFLRAYQQVAESGEACDFEADYSGESMPTRTSFRIVVVPMAGDIAVLAQDITERKVAEEAVRTSEGRYRGLTEHINVGIYRNTAGPEGTFIEANSAIIGMFGHSSKEEFLATNVADLYQNPADRNRFSDLMLKEGSVRGAELLLKRKDGSVFVGSVSAVVVRDEQGQVKYYDGIIDDITERKRTAEELKKRNAFVESVLENAPIGFAVNTIDDGQRVLVSRNFEKIYGVPEGSLHSVADYFEKVYLDPAFREKIRERIMGDMATGDAARMRWEDIPITTRSGECKVVTAINIPLLEQNLMVSTVQDVTDRKRAEEALRLSEERHRTILQTAMDGFWITDRQGQLLDANDAYCRMSGYSAPELLAMRVTDLEVGHTASEIAARIQAIKAQGGEDRFESRHRRKDGSVFEVEISIQYQPTDGGQLVAFLRDITARKQAEEALRIKDWAIDSATNAIVTSDLAGNLSYVNPAFLKLWGYGSPAEVLGKPAVGFWPMGEKAAEVVEAVRANGDWIGELVAQHKDGALFDVHVASSLVVNDAGQPVCMQASFADITDRKRAEEALRERDTQFTKLSTWVPGMIYQFTRKPDGTYCVPFATESIKDLFGCSPLDVREDFAPLARAILPEDLDTVLRSIEYSAEHLTDWTCEYRVRIPGRSIRWMLANSTPEQLADGGITWYGFNTDITARKRAEEEKAGLEAQLQQAQKMESVGRLAGGVAHDFNNMLGVILGHAEVALGRVGPDQPVHGHLAEIRKAAERSANLTRQLLAFARKQTIAPKVLDLNETVAGILKMLRRLIGEDIHLAWRPEADLWPVRVDPSQLDQILANLCLNARDAIADVGKVTIETGHGVFDADYCALHAGFVPGEYVRLAVSDDGCGMDKETLAHVFEPFFTTKDVGAGTGLGLATVYGIVKQNNGFINAYSEPGQGTTFSIYLPRHAGKAEQARTEGEAEPLVRGHETILLVEDERAILEMTTEMLELHGYVVLAAVTPGEAIRMAREHAGEIHLLMTDVVMPEMNGRDLAKNLLSIYPHLKLLFTSGYTADLIAHRGVLDDGVHFLEKPFSMKGLAAKIRQALESD